MTDDLYLQRKWTLRAHGQQVVFVKRPVESTRHVLMKAFLWALYLPTWPQMQVEVSIGGRYKPDVIATDTGGQPLFWGECGHVGLDKLQTILRKHKHTHFALARWAQPMSHAVDLARRALKGTSRVTPFDVLRFPEDAADRFIGADGQIHIDFADLEWTRLRSAEA